jgi:endoglucanase
VTTGDSCAARALIDDAEDGDAQVLGIDGRNGYIYTYSDAQGTQVKPSTDGFTVSTGGARTPKNALRFQGKLADQSDAYAGMGFGFMSPERGYDASAYKGIAFIAKRGQSSASEVRIKVPDGNTHPKGGACSDCFNDFGVTFSVTESWTRYVIEFADLKQEGGWGDPRPPSVDVDKLFGVQFQIAARGQDFDIWIDDVEFICADSSEEMP